MECCGNEVKTPFCPMCGRPIKRTPLLTLLWHVQSHIRINQRVLSKKEQYKGHHESCNRALVKWSDWAKALKKVIQKEK